MIYFYAWLLFSLGLMASKGTWTLLREMSAPLPELPWRGGWQGDREQNTGLPGATVWFWERDKAGELGIEVWKREAAGLALCTGMKAGAGAAVIPKMLPAAVIWLDNLNKIHINEILRSDWLRCIKKKAFKFGKVTKVIDFREENLLNKICRHKWIHVFKLGLNSFIKYKTQLSNFPHLIKKAAT